MNIKVVDTTKLPEPPKTTFTITLEGVSLEEAQVLYQLGNCSFSLAKHAVNVFPVRDKYCVNEVSNIFIKFFGPLFDIRGIKRGY